MSGSAGSGASEDIGAAEQPTLADPSVSTMAGGRLPEDETTQDPSGDGGAEAVDDETHVKREQAEQRAFIKSLAPEDISSGGWFTKLVAHALSSYTDKVDWQYFQEKYAGVPADAIVDQRIKMAARYAALEGGLSAGAYSAAVVATIGTLGGASPATLPAAATTMLVDVTYVTQLQLRLAHDIAVLYRVPLDTSDPEDQWKLIRVAFTIKGGGAVGEGAVKAVPVVVRPLVKRFYAKGTLQAARGLPVVGKYLLQRNVIKIGIPLVGVPLAALLNRYTTLIAGRHARAVFREEASIIELAERLIERSTHPQSLLWVAWLVITADSTISDSEALVMRHLVRLARERHQVVDEVLARLIEVDADDVWARVDAEPGDPGDLVDAARQIAEVDGTINARERAVLAGLADKAARSRG